MKKIFFAILMLYSIANAYEYGYHGIFYNNGVLTTPDSVRIFSRYYPSGDTTSIKYIPNSFILDTFQSITKTDRFAHRTWNVWFGSTNVKSIEDYILPFDSISYSDSYWAKLAKRSDSGSTAGITDTLAIRTMLLNNRFARLSADTTIQMNGPYVLAEVRVLANNVITAASIQDSAFDGSAFKSSTFDSIHFAATYWIKLAKRADSGAVAPTDTGLIKTMLENNNYATTDEGVAINIDGSGNVQSNVISMDANTITASTIANGAIDSAAFALDYWRYLGYIVDSVSSAGVTDTTIIKAMLLANNFARTNLSNQILIDAEGKAQVDVIENDDKTGYSLSGTTYQSIRDTLEAENHLIAMVAYYWGAPNGSYQIHYPIGAYPKDSVVTYRPNGTKFLKVIYSHPTNPQVLDTVKVIKY